MTGWVDWRGAHGVLVGIPEGKRQLGDLGGYGKIMLNLVFNKQDRGVEWIYLAKDRNRWRVTVMAIMNLVVP